MKLTKYEHACFTIDIDGQKLMVDPGSFTNLPEDLDNISILVITHEHGDHYSPENVALITSKNPGLKIFTAKEVAGKIPGAEEPEKAKQYRVGNFELEFYGDTHENIREGITPPNNLGVNINQIVTYPGDSFDLDPKSAKIILAPAAAPWLRMKEAAEFVASCKQQIVIPTHDAVLSEIGKQIHDSHLQAVAESLDKQYYRLATGESLDITA